MALTILIKDQRGEVLQRHEILNMLPEQAIPLVAVNYILAQQLGVLSMNWYTTKPYRLRVYTKLVQEVGVRKKRMEYVGSSSNSFLEISEEGTS